MHIERVFTSDPLCVLVCCVLCTRISITPCGTGRQKNNSIGSIQTVVLNIIMFKLNADRNHIAANDLYNVLYCNVQYYNFNFTYPFSTFAKVLIKEEHKSKRIQRVEYSNVLLANELYILKK